MFTDLVIKFKISGPLYSGAMIPCVQILIYSGGVEMTKKEKLDLILSKLDTDKKEAFISEIRQAKTKEERMEIIRKYGVQVSKEDIESIQNMAGNKVSDEELDQAAGGCSCACSAHCSAECICGY